MFSNLQFKELPSDVKNVQRTFIVHKQTVSTPVICNPVSYAELNDKIVIRYRCDTFEDEIPYEKSMIEELKKIYNNDPLVRFIEEKLKRK